MAAPGPLREVDNISFRDLCPSRFVTFTIPTPTPTSTSPLLRAAVLDSSLPTVTTLPKIAALLVPDGRQADWIFSTEPGHRQLLHGLGQDVSRLILLGDLSQHPGPAYYSKSAETPHAFHHALLHICLLLSPDSAFADGSPDVSFITYEDNLLCSLRIDVRTGPVVGDLLVEDVEVIGGTFRRRLRFKRMPNLVQTEVALEPSNILSAPPRLGETSFRPKMMTLVMPYLAAMTSGVWLVVNKMQMVNRPRVLCIGVGGGTLPMFLKAHFEMDILGVEIDATVIDVAKEYFGLIEDEFFRIVIGDGFKVLKDPTRLGLIWNHGRKAGMVGKDGLVDVMMVDLDSSDALQEMSAPPLVFLPLLREVRSVLSESGVVIVNVITGDHTFLESMLDEMRSLFAEVYKTYVEDTDNIVLLASASLLENVEDEENSYIMKKLDGVLARDYLKLWKKI